MKSQRGYRRPIINGPLLIFISPLLGAMGLLAVSTMSGLHALALILTVTLTVAALVLFSGRVVGALLVALLEVALYGNLVAARETPRKVLLFGSTLPATGVEVSCNGVFLGRTPFRITEAELRAKVEPWTAPPDQPRIDWGPAASWDNERNDRYGWAQFYYVPYDFHDPLEAARGNETQDWKWATGDDDVAREIIADTEHWWHFAQTGSMGLASRSNFAGGSRGTAFESTHWLNPQLEFPSVEPHLERLVALLHADEGQPSQTWLAHWQKHEGLLFVPAWQRAKSDAYLRRVMEAAVRDRYEFSEHPSVDDAERVLGAVMGHARRTGRFMMPSPESLAIDLLGAKAPAAVAAICADVDGALVRMAPSGRASTDAWTVWHATKSDSAELLPLHYAVAQYHPPELFDDLVYASARYPNLLPLVARYSRPEAERIVQDYLHDLAWPSLADANSHSKLSGAMELIVAAPNPNLEALYRQVLLEQAGRNDWGRVHRYIVSRIGAPSIDQGELAGWVFHFAPLDDRQKMELLLKIDDPQVATYLILLASPNSPLQEDILQSLRTTPNPGATAFLVQAAEMHPADAGAALRALATVDNAQARDLLTRWWNQRPERRAEILRALTAAADKGVNVAWAADMVLQADSVELRSRAVPLLMALGSPSARAVLEQWAASDPGVAQAVELARVAKDDALAQQRETLQEARALLAGELKPDDLLDAQPTWVWNGHDYVARES